MLQARRVVIAANMLESLWALAFVIAPLYFGPYYDTPNPPPQVLYLNAAALLLLALPVLTIAIPLYGWSKIRQSYLFSGVLSLGIAASFTLVWLSGRVSVPNLYLGYAGSAIAALTAVADFVVWRSQAEAVG